MAIIARQVLILEKPQEKSLLELLNTLQTDHFRIEAIVFRHPTAALRYLKMPNRIDAALLPIHFDGSRLTGFDVAAAIRRQPIHNATRIIFISTLSHYCSWCFRQYNAYAFVEKPYIREELLKVLAKALSHPAYHLQSVDALHLPIAHTRKKLILHCRDIACIEKSGGFLIIHNKDGSKQIHSITNGTFLLLRKMLPTHPPLDSLRKMPLLEIHRSIIINVEVITEITFSSYYKGGPFLKVRGCETVFPIAKEHVSYMKRLFPSFF